MAETDNPEAPVVAPPRTARFGEGPEGKAARRERHIAPRQPRFYERLWEFLHDTRAEMRRVTWPSLREVQNTTIITLVAVIFFAVYLFLVDQGLARLIGGLNWVLEKIARFLGLA
jgi:preprotein translocase subunit SecE